MSSPTTQSRACPTCKATSRVLDSHLRGKGHARWRRRLFVCLNGHRWSNTTPPQERPGRPRRKD